MLVLIGASASGKTEIAKCLIKNHRFKKMVTYTTRKPRVGEVDGIDYHFLSVDEFLVKTKVDFFLETSLYTGHYYGTAFKDASIDKVLIVDILGAKHLYETLKDDVMIFFIQSPEPIRKARMLSRGDRLEDVEKRLTIDRDYFKVDRLLHVDYVIENANHHLEKITEEIVTLYHQHMLR